MKFISTKEAAELWGISTSRIVKLAKEGRIPNASLVGKSWLIPANAVKPADKRLKKSENQAISDGKDEFIFPLFIYQHYTEHNLLTELSEIEQQLYRAQKLFYECRFRESYVILEGLLRSDINLYIKIGALYTKCFCSVFLKMYTVTKESIQTLKEIFTKDFKYKEELSIILYSLEVLSEGSHSFIGDFKINSLHLKQPSMRPYLFSMSSYSTALHTLERPVSTNPAIYELIAEGLYQDNYLLASENLNLNTSFIYKFINNVESSKTCIRKTINIAIHSNMWYTIAMFYRFNASLIDEVLKEYGPAVRKKLNKLHSHTSECLSGFRTYMHGRDVISSLSKYDFDLVILSIKELSNSEIAEAMNLSETSVSKKLSALYQKTGTRNKKELAALFTSAIRNYDFQI